MRKRLRTDSEFNAFLIDHFSDFLHLIPTQADRLNRENVLLQCVGARPILKALSAPRYYVTWILMPLGIMVMMGSLGLVVWWLINKTLLHELNHPSAAGSIPSISPSTLSVPSLDSTLQASDNKARPSHSPSAIQPVSGQPPTNLTPTAIKTPRSREICTQGILVIKQVNNGLYNAEHVPPRHGYERGRMVSLVGLAGLDKSRRLGYGTIIDAEPTFLSLKAALPGAAPLRLCAVPLGDIVQLGRELGKLLPDGRINVGSGDGVRVSDRYEILGEAVADDNPSGRSLGRKIIGVVRVTAVEATHATVVPESGTVPPGSYIRALRTEPNITTP